MTNVTPEIFIGIASVPISENAGDRRRSTFHVIVEIRRCFQQILDHYGDPAMQMSEGSWSAIIVDIEQHTQHLGP